MGFKCPICVKDFGKDKAKWQQHIQAAHYGAGQDALSFLEQSAQQSAVPDFASVGDFCANCKQTWPCSCSNPVHSCGICAGVIGQECACNEREFIPQTRKAGKL